MENHTMLYQELYYEVRLKQDVLNCLAGCQSRLEDLALAKDVFSRKDLVACFRTKESLAKEYTFLLKKEEDTGVSTTALRQRILTGLVGFHNLDPNQIAQEVALART